MEPLTPVAHLYRCYHDTRIGDRHDCCQIPARLLERFVVQEVFAALRSTPELRATSTVTLAATPTTAAEPDEYARRRATDAVSRARLELREALDRGDDRRVTTALADALKHALAELHALDAKVTPPRPPALSKTQTDALARATGRLEALWKAPTTTLEDRQRLIRAAIRQVVIHRVTSERVDLDLVWASGERTPHRLLRHRAVYQRFQALARMGLPRRRIVEVLHAEGAVVLPLWLTPRRRRRRPSKRAELERRLCETSTPQRAWSRTPTLAGLARRLLQARTSGREIARQLAPERARLGRRRGLGPVFSTLRRRGVEVPPEVRREALAEWRRLHQPRGPRATRTPSEGVARLVALRRAGQSWKAIAAALNANGLRSASGKAFTDTMVMNLFGHYRQRGRFGADQVRPYGPGQVTLTKEALGAWFRARTAATRADYLTELGQRFSAIVLDRARMALEREGHLRPLARPKGGPWRWTWSEPWAADGARILAYRRQPIRTTEARRAVLEFFHRQSPAGRAEYLAQLSPAFSVSILDDVRRALEAEGVLKRLPRSGRCVPGAWSIATAEPDPGRGGPDPLGPRPAPRAAS